MMKKIFFIILACFITCLAFGQAAYRTKNSGNWSDTATWERFNGTSWVPLLISQIPGATDSVYIQGGHTLTLTQDQNCYDLNINSTVTGTAFNLANYKLNISGRIRSFTSAAGVYPVTYT